MKQITRNGISSQSYQSSVMPVKKLIFNQNSCQPTINLKFKTKTIDLCQTRWFFILLISVGCIAIFNLSLTFWIINFLHLNNNGLGFGSFILTKKGINIKSDVTFEGSLDAKLIKSFDGKQALSLNSDELANIVLKNNDYLDNSLTLDKGNLEIQAANFQIRSTNPSDADNINDILFSIEPNQITTNTQNFMFPNLGGYKIINLLETNSIRGNLNHDLKLESRTQKVNVEAERDIVLDSRGGDINLISFDSLELKASELLSFNTKRLEIKNIDKYQPSSMGSQTLQNAYQLCVCESGRLFVVNHDSVCKSDLELCEISAQDTE